MDPTRVGHLMNGNDLVIDATGLTRFATLIGQIADERQSP